MPSICLRLFGAPCLERNGEALPVQRRKTLALLAYLAVTGRPHTREALATLFWQEYDQSGALANLRRDLSRLRSILGEEVLVADCLQVELNPQSGIWLDVAAFQDQVMKTQGHVHERLCDDCQEALEYAANLYGGDFMAGFNLPDSPQFDEWQFFQAEEYRRSFIGILQRLIDLYVSQGEYERGIFYARRWLSLDPLHEPAHRKLMQLYAWSGQQAAALRQFQECQRILQEELGVDPEEETRALYEAIKARRFLSESPKQVLFEDKAAREGRQASDRRESSGRSSEELVQQIRFCTSSDGVRLAYAIVGNGPALVKAANWLSHLEYDWNSPVWRHWLAGLARDHSLVRYDERGCGLSDWHVEDFSLDAWVLDLETVVDAVGLDRFPLLGISQGASIAIAYAVRHPERVSRLILYGGYARGRLHRNLTPEKRQELDVMLQLIKIGWGQEHPAFRQVFSMLFLPEGTPEQLHAFNELQRITTSPDIAARIVSGFQVIDVREQAKRVTQPTLVLHAKGDLRVPFEEGRLLAAMIPDARLVPLEGKNHILLESEPAWKRFLDEVDAFLDEI